MVLAVPFLGIALHPLLAISPSARPAARGTTLRNRRSLPARTAHGADLANDSVPTTGGDAARSGQGLRHQSILSNASRLRADSRCPVAPEGGVRYIGEIHLGILWQNTPAESVAYILAEDPVTPTI